MSLPIDCVRHLRRAGRELSQGMPVSALSALMAAQSTYGRYALGGGFSIPTLVRLQRYIRIMEDRIYPVIHTRGTTKKGETDA